MAQIQSAFPSLPLSGGTMAGSVAMGSHSITGLANGVNPQDGMTMSQMAAGYGVSMASYGLALATSLPASSVSTLTAINETIFVGRCTAYKTTSITTLGVWINTGGVTPGAGVNRLAIYSAAGALLQQTGDMTSAFESIQFAEGAITSQAVVAGTDYYLAVLSSFTGTQPVFGRASTNFAIPVLNGIYTDGSIASQATVPASIAPLSSMNGTGGIPVLYGR
jgi:hypothetical protein